MTSNEIKSNVGIWRGVWRTSKTPSELVPLGGRSVGNAVYRRGWSHPIGLIHWYNFYWQESGVLQLTTSRGEFSLKEREVLILPPETELKYRSVEESGAYQWLTMDGTLAGAITDLFGLTPGMVRQSGNCPVKLFTLLEEAVTDISPDSEYRAGALTYEIMSLAAAGIRGGVPASPHAAMVEKAIALIESRAVQPEFGIDLLADELCLHRSRFSRLFRAHTGLPPADYLRRTRLRFAVDALRRSNLTVGAIARNCGFRDVAYFCRFFVGQMGMTPSAYRRSL